MSITATIERPNGSHWLATEYGRGGGFSKEELFPVLVLEGVPRIGTVRAKFEVSRYVHSSGWSDWRIYPRASEFEPSNGIGDKTRRAIAEAGEPVIREWLASPEYLASRQNAAAHALQRIIAESGVRGYAVENARTELKRHEADLTPADVQRFAATLHHLAAAAALLEETA